MGGNAPGLQTYLCRLCGGRIEGHRVGMGRVVRGQIIRTTCQAQGERLDARAHADRPTDWAARMAAECQARREAARTALTQPIRRW